LCIVVYKTDASVWNVSQSLTVINPRGHNTSESRTRTQLQCSKPFFDAVIYFPTNKRYWKQRLRRVLSSGGGGPCSQMKVEALPATCLAYSSTLKIESIYFFETWVWLSPDYTRVISLETELFIVTFVTTPNANKLYILFTSSFMQP
jgi:hypothetical protein